MGTAYGEVDITALFYILFCVFYEIVQYLFHALGVSIDQNGIIWELISKTVICVGSVKKQTACRGLCHFKKIKGFV